MDYLLLDKNDITKVCGEMSAKELRKEMGNVTNSSLCAFVKKGEPFKDKYIIIEKEFSPEKEVFLENINGIDYYVDNKCRIYHFDAKGNRYYHSTTKCNGRFRVKYGGKEHNLGRIVAKAFIKRNLSKNDVVFVKGNKLKLENIVIMNKHEAGKATSKLAKNNKKVGLFDENGILIDEFHSTREASEKLYLNRSSISEICNGNVKNKIYDLRFI